MDIAQNDPANRDSKGARVHPTRIPQLNRGIEEQDRATRDLEPENQVELESTHNRRLRELAVTIRKGVDSEVGWAGPPHSPPAINTNPKFLGTARRRCPSSQVEEADRMASLQLHTEENNSGKLSPNSPESPDLAPLVGITLTCDIIGSITGNAGIREWHIGICGDKQGRLKWHIGTTRRRIKELEFAGEIKRRNKAVEP